MKTVTVAEAQAHLTELLRIVEAGGEIKVVRRKKAIARIVPMNGVGKTINWSDTWSKVDSIFGGKPVRGKAGSRIVIESRR